MHISNEVKELRLLFDISRLFNGLSEVGERLGEALALMTRHTGMARGAAALLGAGGAVFVAAEVGLDSADGGPGRLKVETLSDRVIAAGRPMAAPVSSDDPLFLPSGRGDLTKGEVAFFSVPIKAGDQTIGALSADRLFADSVSLDEDLRLLSSLAQLIGEAAEVRRELVNRAPVAPRRKKAKTRAAEGDETVGLTLPEAVDRLEIRLITRALNENQGNMGKAAAALGITERIMGLRMKKFGLDYRDFRKKPGR